MSPVGTGPLTYAEPVGPATAVAVADTRSVPMLLGRVFAVVMIASVFAGIASGTRARRRELAVFRAMGGSPRQVRASVRWHALVGVSIGLVLGLPIGISFGRAGFTAFARDIGAAPLPAAPLWLLALIVVAAVAVAMVAASLPARRAAARSAVTDALRQDDREGPGTE